MRVFSGPGGGPLRPEGKKKAAVKGGRRGRKSPTKAKTNAAARGKSPTKAKKKR